MAPRSSWKGHLKLSLVSCPVRLFNATSRSEKVAFHLLQKDTHNRIQMKPHDPELGPVERSDLVKGYEYEKDQYVVFSDEDFDKVQIETTKAIVIEKFVDAQEVDPIYFDTPYYLAPDGAVAEETYRVIQHAMRDKHKVALSRIVLANRERLIALTCRDQGFLMMTLRTADEVRDSKDYFTDIKDERARAGDARSGREADRAEVRQVRSQRVQGPLSGRGDRDGQGQDQGAGAGARQGARARQGDQPDGCAPALARGRQAAGREQAAPGRGRQGRGCLRRWQEAGGRGQEAGRGREQEAGRGDEGRSGGRRVRAGAASR